MLILLHEHLYSSIGGDVLLPQRSCCSIRAPWMCVVRSTKRCCFGNRLVFLAPAVVKTADLWIFWTWCSKTKFLERK